MLVTQSTLCNRMDCSLSGSSVLGIFQARILELVAIFFSRVKCYRWYQYREQVRECRMKGKGTLCRRLLLLPNVSAM